MNTVTHQWQALGVERVLWLKGYKIHNRLVATDFRVVSSPFTAGFI